MTTGRTGRDKGFDFLADGTGRGGDETGTILYSINVEIASRPFT